MLNGDKEAKSCPTLTLQGRERKHSHTSQGYEENWVLWGIPGQDQKGKGTYRERQSCKGLYSLPLKPDKTEKTESCSDPNICLGKQEKNEKTLMSIFMHLT